MNGGLDLATAELFGATVAWHVEYDTAPSKILAHHWPDVPNYGDVTTVDWSSVEPVNIITGGSPCQDLSAAGKRAGMTEGTRSNLWVNMRHAIDQLRPSYVLWENVLGALSAPADSASDMVPDAGPLGNPGDGHLRALGRVLGDLAEIGYDARWTTVRASDVGAPHHRARVFLLATPSDTDGRRLGEGAEQPGASAAEIAAVVGDHGPLSRGGRTDDLLTVLPTPAACNPNDGEGPETWLRRREEVKARVGNGNGMGMPLTIAVQLLPTPRTTDSNGPGQHGTGGPDLRTAIILPTPSAADGNGGGRYNADGHQSTLPGTVRETGQWGRYAPAIRRWESVLGRPAPSPTELNRNGKPRLSAEFASWMMGLPAGHVTDPTIGISRADQLKAIGNGVSPQQCYAAGRILLEMELPK